MFYLHHRRWFNTPTDYAIVGGPFETLMQATLARKVAGDLVVDAMGFCVQDSWWLWPWEIANASYAVKALEYDHIRRDKMIPSRHIGTELGIRAIGSLPHTFLSSSGTGCGVCGFGLGTYLHQLGSRLSARNATQDKREQ